jgi:hypothetical protein
VADGHARCTQKQHFLAAKIVDKHNSWDGEHEIDNPDNASCENRDGLAVESNLSKD